MPDLESLGIEPLAGVAAQVADVWAWASNGMGGLDWYGVELAARWFDVHDTELLVDGLIVIKTHRPDRADNDADTPASDDWPDDDID